MSGLSLRLLIALLAALGLAACEKKEAGSASSSYGKQDAECFAGIIKEADTRHMSPTDFSKWESRLNDKDKIWVANFANYHASLTKIVTSHMGKTTKELVEAKVLTEDQQTVIDAYVKLAQDGDAERVRNIATRACSSIGFSKGPDLN